MNQKMTAYLSIVALMGLSMGVRADDTTSAAKDTIAHPVEAYHQHEVKEDAVDAQVYAQQKAEAKARFDQAKADYEKSLQANGAESEVTKQAKKRFIDARKEYKKLAMKTSKANKELKEDTNQLNKDKAVQ